MKKLFVIITAIAALVVFSLPIQAATNTQKIGVVNVQEILQKAPQIAQIRTDLQKQFGSREKKLGSLQKTLQTDAAKLHKNSAVMSAKNRKNLENKIVKEQENLQKEQISFQQDFMQAQNKQLGGFLAKVRNMVKNIAKQDGYNIVLTKASVAYADDHLDITSEVLKGLK